MSRKTSLYTGTMIGNPDITDGPLRDAALKALAATRQNKGNAMSLQAAYRDNGIIELWDFSEDGGGVVRCHPDGRIELFEVPQYGGDERPIGNYPTVCAAFAEAAKWT